MAKIDDEKYRLTPEIARYVKEKRRARHWSRSTLANRVGTRPQYIRYLEEREWDRHPLLPAILDVLAGRDPEFNAEPTPAVRARLRRAVEGLDISARALARAAGSPSHDIIYRIIRGEGHSSIWVPVLMEVVEQLEEEAPAKPIPVTEEVIQLIRRRRRELGLSTVELAQRIGASRTVVQRLERGVSATCYYLPAILDVLAGREPREIRLPQGRAAPKRDGKYRKAPPPPGVVGTCRRCETLLFDDADLIPAGWPRENHVRVEDLCLECWLAQKGRNDLSNGRSGLLSECFAVLAAAG